MQGSDAESMRAIMGPTFSPGPRNPVSVAVAAAGVLQPLSNFKFATVLFLNYSNRIRPNTDDRYSVFGRIVKLPYSVQP